MQAHINAQRRGWIRVGLICLGGLLIICVLRRPLMQVLSLLLGAGFLCFLASPVARRLENRLPRPLASLCGLLFVIAAIAILLSMLLPVVLRELAELTRVLPDSVEAVTGWADRARLWLESRLSGISLPLPDWSVLEGRLSDIASGTLDFAINLADLSGRISLTAVLAYFLLRDRERVLLRIELLLPQSQRHLAVSMGHAVLAELRMYLNAQLMIAGAIACLSAVALLLIGVRSAVILGLLIGLFNMIPYFGPFIGGAPAVLIALTGGWRRAAFTLAALFAVQQLDGAWISPRIMGSVTGFSPALVLLGVFAGARIGGIAGMLFALPSMMVVRTLYRVFVQKSEKDLIL